jgi:hypothetical protein
MKKKIIGKIIGNKGKDIIVETITKDIYILDRFSAIRWLHDDMQIFEVSKDYKIKKEVT